MKRKIYGVIYCAVLFGFVAGATTVRAQHENHGAQAKPTPAPEKKTEHQHDHGGTTSDMVGQSSHHALALAFHESMAVFTKTLRQNAEQTAAVDGDFAREAVAEIRRGFDQMQRHHQEHLNMLTDSARTEMEATMKQMEPHHAKVREELEALERETGVEKPDRARVLQHTTELLKQLNEMSGSHNAPTEHHH
jgi:Skp family chaperone for outer membrane proteins